MNAQSQKFGIYGSNVQIAQYLDFPTPGVLGEPYVLILNFPDVRLLNPHAEVFKGNVIARSNVEPCPASIAVFVRFLTPFEGHFDLIVNGTVALLPTNAELTTTGQVLSTNLQPLLPPTANARILIDPATGLVADA